MEPTRYRTKWLPIAGFEGLYEVSNGGRIRSVRYCNKQLKQATTDKGYKVVQLTARSGVRVWRKVHRLVAIAHIPNPEGKTEVNHKRGRKWDNRASQLEWMTRAENLQHMRDEGLTRGPGKKRKTTKSNTNVKFIQNKQNGCGFDEVVRQNAKPLIRRGQLSESRS